MAVCQTKVVHVEAVADNVTHLKLAVPEGCTWQTGQFTRIALPTTGEPQWRCYSIASKAGSETLDFFIARVKGGAVSPRLAQLKVGDNISDETITDKYERIFLVHGVRHWHETSYLQHVLKLQPKLRVMASVTREPGAIIDERIPDALENGHLEEVAERQITAQDSRVMLCGNPAMVKAVRASLKARGIVSPRNGQPGQLLAENFWL